MSKTADMFKDLFAQIRTISHQVNLTESLVKLMRSANPQILGYLPPAAYSIPSTIYDQLIMFKAERGLESVEMAVSVILEEYFGLLQIPATTNTTTSRLETLEAKCTSLSETVAELQRTVATIQASNSQPGDYQGTLLHQQSPLLFQAQGAVATESINSHSVDQGESLQPSAVNDLQTSQSELEQLPSLEPLSERQSVNNIPLSVEDSEALKLTEALTSTSDSKDIESESVPSIEEQPNLERGEEISITSMMQADLAKRLGVATSTVSRMQSKPNFPDWSKQRDPLGIAWVKSADTKLFYPQSQG